MTLLLLDTNICVHAMKRHPSVVARLQKLSPDAVGISVITLAELRFGARKSQRPDPTRRSLDAFLQPLEVFPFDSEAAEAYSEIRLDLERRGLPIGERDLLIAATALSRGRVVVTHNIREFSRVPGLRVEDWA